MNTLAKLTDEYPRLAREISCLSGMQLLSILYRLKEWRSLRFAYFDGRFSTIERLARLEMECRTGYSEEYFK